jgi:hypothetical protein
MKWFSIAPFCAFVVLTTACEKHPASDLPPEFRGESKHAEVKHDGKPAAEHPEIAKPEAAKPATDAKPGEAPKFFPENK